MTDQSSARKTRTEQARKVLADTHVARPILGRIRSATAHKLTTLDKKHRTPGSATIDLARQYEADIEALKRVEDLLDRMNAKAFETLQADLRRDLAAEIAGSFVQIAKVSS